jgi:hypothetical protein
LRRGVVRSAGYGQIPSYGFLWPAE